MSERELQSLDAEIQRVQRSTKTLFPTFTGAHNWLRMKSQLYYRWHMSSLHTAIHVFVLLAYTASITFLSHHLMTDVRIVHASGPTTYDLADTANFNIRIDGAAAGDQLGTKGITTADFNGNGKNDVIVASYYTDHNAISNSGSVYVIFDVEDKNLTGTGNTIDLADTSAYHLRFDGTHTSTFGFADPSIAAISSDYNGDGKEDLIIAMSGASSVGTNAGTLYLISNELLVNTSGTGNAFHLADTSSYSIKVPGPVALDLVGGSGSLAQLSDLDGDGKNDLVVSAPGMDYGAPQTGSVFLISGTTLSSYTGTGNTLDLTDPSKYIVRLDGHTEAWSIGFGLTFTTDINGNGKSDLVIGDGWADTKAAVTSNNAGAIYVIYDDLIRSYSGTGNTVSLSNTETWNVRIDGAASADLLGLFSLSIGDIDGDSKPDIAAGSNTADNSSRTDSGSVWIINNTLITGLNGTGNILDLSDSADYSIRLDGAAAGDALSYNNVAIADFNNDGKSDLLTGAHRADHNSRVDSGSVYYIDSAALRNYTGTGNLIDMSDTSKYSIRWDAAETVDRLVTLYKNMEDYNGDGIGDLILNSYSANFNSRADSGSIYVIYNFPHTIATPTIEGDNTSPNRVVAGTISASSSITNISSVQASINTTTFAGDWVDCSATDGAFDNLAEAYSCNLTLPSEGTHTIRIRAKDTNGVYTPISRYKSAIASYSLPVSPSPSTTSESVSPSPSPIVEADTTAPALTLTAIGNTKLKKTPVYFTYVSTNPRPTFSGTTEVGATVTVKAGDKELCQTVATSESWSCTTEKLDFVEHSISIAARDAANNETRLDTFTLKVEEPKPSPATTTAPTTKTNETPTPVTEVTITNTPSPTGFIPDGATPYAAKVRVEDEQVILSRFKVRVLDSSGKPLADALVTLRSSPRSAVTDNHGVAIFGNVPTGRHTLTYAYAGATISQPINIAVTDDVKASILSGESVEITLEPVEIKLPVTQFGLITAAWIILLILTTTIAGYFGFRYAYRIFPQWGLATSKQQIDLEEFEEEIHKVQHSTETTWRIFMPLHNWLRMKSKAYYWWHLLPHNRLWTHLILGAYILFVAIILYQSFTGV